MNIEAIDFLNQLNEYGKIDYADYSHLHDLLTSAEPEPSAEHYDEGTLVKVYDALIGALPDTSEWVIRDLVNAMQNAGILFRERGPEPQDEPSDAQEVEFPFTSSRTAAGSGLRDQDL